MLKTTGKLPVAACRRVRVQRLRGSRTVGIWFREESRLLIGHGRHAAPRSYGLLWALGGRGPRCFIEPAAHMVAMPTPLNPGRPVRVKHDA